MTAALATTHTWSTDVFDPTHAPRLDPGIWHRVLTNLRLTSPTLNRTWFDQLSPRQLDNGVIYVTCKTLAQYNFLTANCQETFNAAAQSVTNRLSVVMFHCPLLRTTGAFDATPLNPWGVFGGGLPLSPDHGFDNFIVGPNNELAHAASVAIANQPGKDYNPLFLHGGVGRGKTHLLQAICQRLLETRPEFNIIYLSCEAFISQFMLAVEGGDMNAFRHRYRNADALIVDDIHFLKGRERTQEEFFHTFNTLYQQRKQIVLASDAKPEELPELEERLVSRFACGFVCEVRKPDFDTRVAILRSKSRLRGLELPDDVINYVAGRIDSNPRALEGAINSIQGQIQLPTASKNGLPVGRTVPIDLALARKALGDAGKPDEPKRVTVEAIVEAVVRYYGVKLTDLHSKKRNRSVAFPRQICMFLARAYTRYSLEEVGGYFGGRDHTTVLHGVRTVANLVETNEDVARQVKAIEQQLGAD